MHVELGVEPEWECPSSPEPSFEALRSPKKRGAWTDGGLLRLTPGFLIHDFLTDRKSPILGVWAAPGGRETFQKGGGRSPPSFLEGFPAARGPPRPRKIDDFRSKNHILKT